MRISDVFLLTSAFEGMPRCVLESLACGLPVVTTDVGEVKVVVREFSGIVVKTEHANDLSDAVLKIFGEPYNYKSECCIESVLPYSAQTILDMVYKYYYDANRNLEDI
jgi:glycosyltransferase involved in cell wall biosynthesis